MNLQPLIGEMARQHMGGIGAAAIAGRPAARDPLAEAVVTGAVMVACAFRLRDEVGLIAALRELTAAVDGLERATAEG